MSFKLTWYGHATLGLEIDGQHVLIDPFFTGNPAATLPASATTGVDELPADFILVTHGHGDHLGDTEAIARRTGATVISINEIAVWCAKKGLKTHGQHIGGGCSWPFGYLKLTLALHGSALPDGSNGGNPAGFLLTTPEGKKLYIAGDTGLFGDMRLIGDEGIDLAVLPIGDNYTMGPADALRAVQMLRPKHVIPVHYNTWELIRQDPHAWATQVREQTGTEPHVLAPGESFELL